MAKVTVGEFDEALKADKELGKRFEETLKGVTGAANDSEAVQKAAAELGYELSLEELERAWAAAQELDVADLDAVAGGNHYADEYCFTDYSCYTTILHDGEGKPKGCLQNYLCQISNK